MSDRPYLLQDVLTRAALRDPDRVAVSCGGSTLSYAALARRSDEIAALLQRLGVRRGDLVGVCLPKGTEVIAAWFGVLKAGAAYVPLDASSPAPRLRSIIAHGRLRALIAQGSRRELVEAAPPTLAAVVWDGAPGPAAGGPVAEAQLADAQGTPRVVGGADLDLAYVYFTSGSTGTPKGAAISHRASLSYIDVGNGILGCAPDDVVANHAPLAFDLASFDVHLAMRAGAKLSLIPESTLLMPGSLLRYFEDERPTLLYAVPTALHRLAAIPTIGKQIFPSLRGIIFAGEPAHVTALRTLRPVFPRATFHHWYGSTEAALVTAMAFAPEEPLPDPLPIGRAVANVDLALADDGGAFVELGAAPATGELLVAATLLLDGYCNETERNEAAFLVRGGPSGLPVRWFRTRDIVRSDETGALHYVGRSDRMVKVKGLRVDLGEIEAALGRLGARECAVVAKPDVTVGARLHGFIAGSEGDAEVLLAALRRELPGHLVPERLSALPDGLPHTASGKIDRLALARQL
jgi:amino acid adenylation domain-containing protein